MNLLIASQYLHLISMAAWVGGMLYMVLVEVPVLKGNLEPAEFSSQMSLLGKRFKKIGWILLFLLFTTGVLNIILEQDISAMMKSETYRMSITIKLILFTLMVLNTAIHSLYLGPKMSQLAEKISSGSGDDLNADLLNLRKRSMFSSALSLLLSLIIVYFGLLASQV